MLIWDDPIIIYIIFFIGAIGFSVLINKIMLRFSLNLGMRNKDGLIRWSSEEKPSLGGLTFFIIFLLSIASLSILPYNTEGSFNAELLGIFAACTFGFLVGLADDAYNTKPIFKFLGQITCANLLIAAGIVIPITPEFWINYIFTVLWVVGLMNSINMLDNMDGVTASVSVTAVCAMLLIVMMESTGFNAYALVLIGVAASLIGFLYFNWHPSKMFMGDTGSQFLGVFLAAFSIMYLWHFKQPTEEYFQVRQFVAPLMVFIMPLIDTITVFSRRIARGQSPFVGGKDHTTHHLAYLGIKDNIVSLIFLTISSISIIITYYIYTHQSIWNINYTWVIVGYFLVLFTVFQILYELGKKKNASKAAAIPDAPATTLVSQQAE